MTTSDQDTQEPTKTNAYGLVRIASRIGPMTLLVQLLSFGSSVILARWLGATVQTDAYYFALSIPTIANAVLIGASRQAAIPALTEIEHAEGFGAFELAASEIATGTAAVSCVLGAVVAAALIGLAPTFIGHSTRFVALARLYIAELTPYAVTGALLGVLGAILAVRRSYVAAVAVFMIEPVLKSALVVAFGHQIGAQSLVIGNVLGNALAVVLLLLFARHLGIRLRIVGFRNSRVMRSLVRLSVPLLVSSSLLQLNPVIDRSFAASLGGGSITVFEFGVRLFNVPAALLGSTMVAPLAASWSALRTTTGWSAVISSSARTVKMVWVLVLPIVVVGYFLRMPLIGMLYHGGAFTAADVMRTANVLGMLLVGLIAQIVVLPLATLFIVRGDTVFPMKVGIANFVLNAALDWLLRGPMGLEGIAFSTSITMTVLVGVFICEARRRWGALGILQPVMPLVLSIGTAVMGGTLAIFAVSGLGRHSSRLQDVAVVAGAGGAALAIHGLVILLVRGSVRPQTRLLDLLLARLRPTPRLMGPNT